MKKMYLFLLLPLLFLSFKNSKEKNTVANYSPKKTISNQDSRYYVTAESGLLCREEPNGKIIHKFTYGTLVKVIHHTDVELTITDDGKEITGNWVEVEIENTHRTGYVFDGFLAPMALFYLDVEKIAKLTPLIFKKSSNTKGLILKGTYNIYDKNLNVIKQINVNATTDVKILSATKFERPKTKDLAEREEWQDYCEWANFLKIIYNNKELIVFGENILEIKNNKKHIFKNKDIHFIEASSFLKKTGTLTEELSGCFCGDTFIIKYNREYSLVYDSDLKDKEYLFFIENEYGSESMYDIEFKNDTIFSKVSQSFQEGTGKYKLKFFKDNGWKYIIYDKTRDYNNH